MSNFTDLSRWRLSRRDALLLGIGGLLVAVPMARRKPLALVRRHTLVMGTIAEFAVADRDPRRAEVAIAKAVEALRLTDAAMSRFNAASDVGRVNARAAREPVAVSPDTMAVLGESLRWAEASEGAFDPCLGRSVALWDVTHRHEPPPAADVARLAGRGLYKAMDLDTRGGRPVVRLRDPEASLDLGGIAKGHGVDRAIAALREEGIEHALVGAGGDLHALGRSPAGEPWTVGIQAPDRPDALAGTLGLEDEAIATSGDYQQFFVHRHRRYHHLLDPATGAPRVTPERSVSVVAPTCMAADAGATLAFVASRPAAARVLARYGARIVHSI